MMTILKEIFWVGSSKEDISSLPDEVKISFGFELYQVQEGKFPASAKPLKGNDVKGVYELRVNHDGNTYRTMYIAKLGDKIYVLHSFQKKSKSGIATPKAEMEIVKQRLKLAKEDHKGEKK